MRTKAIFALVILAGSAAAAAYAVQNGMVQIPEWKEAAPAPNAAPERSTAPAVTVASAKPTEFVETVLVTGSLIPREEILVAPEVEGLKVVALKADIGDRVKKGDVLAVLVSEALDAQIAQSDAALARAEAAIARSRSVIVEAEARVAEATAALERAKPLTKSGYLSESIYDQREATAKSAAAQLAAARDGLTLAEAEKAQAEAQRRELDWRRSNTEVRAPADGIVSRRAARIGSIAVGAFVAGGGEPLFRIIKDGEVELDAEVSESRLVKIEAGQPARIETAGSRSVTGRVRLVSPEVDATTRLGRVRVFIGDEPALKIGAFARASIETARKRGLGIPQSAVLYGDNGATVLAVVNNQVSERRIETGLSAEGRVEVLSGLEEGDLVVAKAGTFLRDGDAVRPVEAGAAVSEVD